MPLYYVACPASRVRATVLVACALCLTARPINAQEIRITLPDHLPSLVAASRMVEPVPAQEKVKLALVLPLHNQAQLEDLLYRLYDPADPAYGQYLTTEEFTDAFGPSREDYAAMAEFARSWGLQISAVHPNRLLLDVEGDADTVGRTFGVKLMHYRAPDGRIFHAPDRDPSLPAGIAARLSGVLGLDTASVPHNRLVRPNPGPRGRKSMGSGPNGDFTPSDIATAYDLTGLKLKNGTTPIDGKGQVLGLFELAGYAMSDIAAYERAYFPDRITPRRLPTLKNILIDGYNGSPGDGSDEVTLDIELQIALAPGAKEILVYESPGNTNAQWLDCYNRIATDNLAESISTSWGQGTELSAGRTFVLAENAIFEEMAAQGQSLYSASGDWGCYAPDYSSIALADPTSPWMVTVGGTTLFTAGAGGAYLGETTWNDHYQYPDASGGGISAVYGIPDYQAQPGVVTSASLASSNARNMPDVALNADPDTGYSIYLNGSWMTFGGTSCAAPLWSAFNALVNQKRAVDNKSPLNRPLGFPNPALYAVGLSARYSADYHDIADGSTNGSGLFSFAGYPAVAGFDDSAGWGSFIGAGLLADLAGDPKDIVSQLLGNPGFESGQRTAPWKATGSIINQLPQEPAHSGTWKAWFGSNGKAHTDTLLQEFQLPVGVHQAILSFWLHIDTAAGGTKATDKLTVAIKDAAGVVLARLVTYSNLNKNTGFSQVIFDLSTAFSLQAHTGSPLTLILTGTQAGAKATSFVVDDFALNVH